MPAVALAGGFSTGHGCFFPVPALGPFTTGPVVTLVNGLPVQTVGTFYGPIHSCGPFAIHPCGPVVTGSFTSIIMSPLGPRPIARIGDIIACGDMVAIGSPNTFFA